MSNLDVIRGGTCVLQVTQSEVPGKSDLKVASVTLLNDAMGARSIIRASRVCATNMSQSAMVHSYDDMCGTNNQIHSMHNLHGFCEITCLSDALIT